MYPMDPMFRHRNFSTPSYITEFIRCSLEYVTLTLHILYCGFYTSDYAGYVQAI